MAKETGLDNDYLNSITGLTGDQDLGDDAPTFSSNEDDGDGDGQQQADDKTGSQGDQSSAAESAKAQVPGQDQQNQQQPQTVPQGLRRHVSGDFVNAEGDIVRADGTVVAPRGNARRLHEENTTLRRDRDKLTERATTAERRLQETTFLNNVPQQFGLTNDEVAHALDIEARIKRGDAVGAAKEVIAMLAAKGHNISELLGANVGDSVDMRAIRTMLDERLAPITNMQQQTERDEVRERVAREKYDQFVTDNEYADIHGETIVALKESQGVSMQQAYNMVRTFAVQNGLDMSQPLGPQIDERQALAFEASQQQQQQPQPRKPMINGANTQDTGVRKIAPVYADPDDDWGTIIRNAQQEGNLN